MNKITTEEASSRISSYSLHKKGQLKLAVIPDLFDVLIEHTDISDVELVDISAGNSQFNECKFQNVDFYGAFFSRTILKNCRVESSVFRKGELNRVDFDNCSFVNCDFSRCDFMYATISNCVFKNCDFSGIIFSDNTITNTVFEDVNVFDAAIGDNEEDGVEWKTYEKL